METKKDKKGQNSASRQAQAMAFGWLIIYDIFYAYCVVQVYIETTPDYKPNRS